MSERKSKYTSHFTIFALALLFTTRLIFAWSVLFNILIEKGFKIKLFMMYFECNANLTNVRVDTKKY